MRAAGALIVLLASGCAGEGPPTGEDETWFGQIQSEVFDQSCLSGACHNSATRAGNLSLAAGESYDQLVDIEPENNAAREAGLLRVLPNSVSASFLVAKLTGDLASGEGAQMPLAASALPPDQILLIEEWIAAGASETDPPPGSSTPTEPTNPDAPSYAELQRELFDASCVSAACHSDATRAGGLSLTAGSSYDALVGVPPITASARADGLLLVTPSETNASFLLNKLTGELMAGDGSQMPLAGAAVPDSLVDLVRDWIAAGAPPDA